MAKINGVRFLNHQFKKALILENPDPSLDNYLRAQGIEPERLPDSVVQRPEAVIERLKAGQHDLIFKRSRFIVDERVLQASEHLAAVILCCIGDDSVDKEACAREGVMVMNDPISNARSVVELVFGEMICLARRVFQANEAAHQHIWTKDNRKRYELLGKKIAIIGLGNIGKQVAQMAEKFGMEVYFYDTREVAREVGATLGWKACRTIAEAFRVADFVTVHVSAEDYRGRSNRNLITYEHFVQLGAERGPNSPRIFINVARGLIHEPEALIRAVREGYVQAAAVDVYPNEPASKSESWHNPYAGIPEIVCTPHIGAATEEAQPRIAAHVASTTHLFNRYGTVRDTVFSPGQVIGVETEPPYWVLSVVHSDARGTKKAISDAIYEAGASNLQSSHRDFSRYGFAYEVSAIDRPLSQEQLLHIVEAARRITGDPTAIRAIRQFYVPANGTDF